MSKETGVSDDVVFQENCNTFRHYGNMRFALFTGYVLILGALLPGSLEEKGGPGGPILLTVASLLILWLYWSAEGRIAYLINFYQEGANKIAKSDQERADAAAPGRFPLPEKHCIWNSTARRHMQVMAVLLYVVFVVAIWLPHFVNN